MARWTSMTIAITLWIVAAEPTHGDYIPIQKGDTLETIAVRICTPKIRAANHNLNPNRLSIGELVRIPFAPQGDLDVLEERARRLETEITLATGNLKFNIKQATQATRKNRVLKKKLAEARNNLEYNGTAFFLLFVWAALAPTVAIFAGWYGYREMCRAVDLRGRLKEREADLTCLRNERRDISAFCQSLILKTQGRSSAEIASMVADFTKKMHDRYPSHSREAAEIISLVPRPKEET